MESLGIIIGDCLQNPARDSKIEVGVGGGDPQSGLSRPWYKPPDLRCVIGYESLYGATFIRPMDSSKSIGGPKLIVALCRMVRSLVCSF